MREEVSSQENLCYTYRQTFSGTSAWDAREYAELGDGGCPVE